MVQFLPLDVPHSTSKKEIMVLQKKCAFKTHIFFWILTSLYCYCSEWYECVTYIIHKEEEEKNYQYVWLNFFKIGMLFQCIITLQ